MGLVETIKNVFVSQNKAVYRCENCGETVETDADAPPPSSCPECEAGDLTMINRV